MITDQKTVRKIAWGEPDYQIRRDRQLKEWKEMVVSDLKKKVFINWKQEAKDKKQ